MSERKRENKRQIDTKKMKDRVYEREREELLGTETNNRNNEIEVIENDK